MNARQKEPAPRFAQVEGLFGAAAVDLETGSVEVALDRGAGVDLELAALLEGDVLELARAAATRSDPGATIDSIVFAAGPYFHVLVPARPAARRFLYLLVERDRVPLGLLLHYLDISLASGSSSAQEKSCSPAALGSLKA